MPVRKHDHSYDNDLKETAVTLTEINGIYARDIAEAINTHEVKLYRWHMEMWRGKIMAEHALSFCKQRQNLRVHRAKQD